MNLQAPVRTTRKPKLPVAFKAAARKAPAPLNIKSILVPIDFSAGSEKALVYAIPLARRFGAQLNLLYVLEPIATPAFAAFPLTLDQAKIMAKCKRRLDRIVKDLRIDPMLVKRRVVRYGRAFEQIAEVARALKVNLIVICTRGVTGLKHIVGSTTERMIRKASCPVLVVRPRQHEFLKQL